jgi:hypothetical protein
MGLMSDAAGWWWLLLLMTHWCQAMPIIAWKLAESFSIHQQNWTKSGCICGHETYQLLADP